MGDKKDIIQEILGKMGEIGGQYQYQSSY